MANGDLGVLKDSPIRIAQYSDENYTLFAYDVALDEQRRETGRDRMDLSSAVFVYQVKDPSIAVSSGTPTSALTFSTPTVTLVDSAAAFTTALVGRYIKIENAPTGANDGWFLITGVPSATSLEFTNAAGVAEGPGSMTYELTNIVIYKNSGDAAQIEIDADQVDSTPTAGKGTGVLKLLGADTSELSVGGTYYHDAWVHVGGKVKRILKKSRLYVDDGVYEPSIAPPLPAVGAPAPQSSQSRSFKWTALVSGDDFTITIPGGGMVDASYIVSPPDWSTIPPGGAWTPTICPETPRTATTFQLLTNVPILAGTVLGFIVRDS